MRIQTILNRVEKFKSFVYRNVRLEEQDDGPGADRTCTATALQRRADPG